MPDTRVKRSSGTRLTTLHGHVAMAGVPSVLQQLKQPFILKNQLIQMIKRYDLPLAWIKKSHA